MPPQVRSTSKELVRDTVCWVKDEKLRDVMVRWTVAYNKALKVYLREEEDIAHEVKDLLKPHETTKLAASYNFPLYTLQVLTKLVERARLSEIREEKLLISITKLNDAVGPWVLSSCMGLPWSWVFAMALHSHALLLQHEL